LGDIRGICLVEKINIRLGKVGSLLVQSQCVALGGLGGIRDAIKCLDASRGHCGSAILQRRRESCRCGTDSHTLFTGFDINRRFNRSWVSTLRRELAFDDWDKLDTGRDIINVRPEMLWDVIPESISQNIWNMKEGYSLVASDTHL
jgi:hypothetical protein